MMTVRHIESVSRTLHQANGEINMKINAILATGSAVATTQRSTNQQPGNAALGASRRRSWGVPISLALHGCALAALWFAAQGTLIKPTPARTIEISLAPAPEPTPLQPAAPAPAPIPRPAPHPPVTRRLQARPHPVPPAVPTQAAPSPPLAAEAHAAPAATKPTSGTATPAPPPASPPIIGNAGMPSDYVNTVFTRINAHVRYPASARREGAEGTVGYTLTLSPAGELLDVSIKSSGSAELDDAALESIRAAAPFGALPDLGGTRYRLTGAIEFALR